VTHVTEIPEHLLRRSRERRAALGLGGEEGAAPSGSPEAAPAAGTPAVASAPTPAPVPREPRPAPSQPPPPRPDPPYIAAAKRRRRIPFWVMPVVGLLPLWAYMYARGLEPPKKTVTGPVGAGQAIFASKCSSCHGPQGEGGVGYQLNDGQVLLSFPAIQKQFAFVYTGNKPYVGLPYGSGRHIGGQKGVGGAMPAWGQADGGELTDVQINEVVCYERYGLGGGDVTSQEYADWCATDAPNFATVEASGFAGAGINVGPTAALASGG
jgi:mono/diheme cytochrome c family protein